MKRLLVFLTFIHFALGMGGRGETGKCSYRFDVWTPDQNIVRRIEHLDQYQKNMTSYFNMELLKLRNDVLNEVITIKNATHAVEKEVLQQKVENVKLRIEQQEMHLNLLKQKDSNVIEIEEEAGGDSMRESQNSKSRGGDGKIHSSKAVNKLKSEVAKVQNSIGDLRAEWLLIKREIQKLRHSDNRLNQSYREMMKRMSTVETMVSGMQSDSLLIKRQQNDLMSENSGLGQKVMDVQKENDKLKQYQHRIRKSNSKIHEHLQRLKSENSYLHQSLGQLDDERDKLRTMLGNQAENISRYEYDVKANVPSIGGDVKKDMETLGLQTAPKVLFDWVIKGGGAHQSLLLGQGSDCDDLYRLGHVTSGLYRITMENKEEQVYCDMYNNTGWIVVQRRVDGLLKFQRGWLEYKFGFGNPYGEFWQGNEFLFKISNSGKYTLRIEMWDWEGASYHADYDHFLIESEKKQYRLHVNKYHGTAGDSLSYHNDMSFSTDDMDNDVHVRNCAADYKGGWWYHSCYSSNLNGLYHTGWYSGVGQAFSDGVVWYTLKQSDFYSLRRVEMKLRPQN